MKLPPKARASPRAALASVPLNPVSSKRPTPATTSRHGSASGSAAASASTRQTSRPPATNRARSVGGTRSQSHSSTAGSTHAASSGGKSQSTSAPSSFSFHRQNTAPTSASNSSSAAASRAASFHRHVTPPTSTSTTTAAAASSTQFRRTSSSSLHAATFFSGLLFYVTGRSKAESVRAKELITTAGGTVVQRETDASHLVCISGAGVKKIEQALSLGALSNAQSFGTAPKRHLEMVRVAVATQNANTSSSTSPLPTAAIGANHQVHSTSHFHQTASGGGAKFPDVVPASALHKGPRFVATLAWLEHCHRSRVLGALPTRKALLAEFCKAPEKEVIDRDEDDVVPATHAVASTASSTATHQPPQSTTSAKSAKSNGSGNGRCGTAPVLTSPRSAPLLVSSMPVLTKPSSAKALTATSEAAAAIGSTATATAAATGADRKRSPFAAAAPPVVTRTKQQVTVGRTAPVPATASVFTKSMEQPFCDGNTAGSRRTSRTDLKTTVALSERGAVGGAAAPPPARKRGRPASVASSASASPATSSASDFDAAETSSDESVASSDSSASSATSSCFSSSTEEARDSTLDLLLSRQASRRASAVAYASSGEFGAASASGASGSHRRSIIDVDAVDEKLLYSPQISWESPTASLQSGNALSLDDPQNDQIGAKRGGKPKGSNGAKIGEDDGDDDDVLNPLDFFQCERVLIAEAAHTIEQNRGHHQQRICVETGQPQSTPPRRHRRLSSEVDAAFVSPNGGREGRGSTESGSSESCRFSSPMGRDLDARRSVHHRPHTDIEAFEQKFSELEEAREQMRKSIGPTKDPSSRRARAIRAVSEPRPDEPRPDAPSTNRGDGGVASKSHPKILIDDDEDMPPPAHLITSPTAPKAPKVRPTPKLSSPKLMSPDLPSTPCSAGSAAGVAARAMAPPKVPQAPPRREGKRTRSAVRQETAAAASLFSDSDTGCAEGASASDGSKPLIAPAQDRPGRRHLVTIKSPSQERPAPAQDESAVDASGGKSRMGVRARLEADAERRKEKLAELVAAHETDLLHRSGVSRLRARTPPPSQTTASAKSSKSTHSNALGDASSSTGPCSVSTAASSKSKASRTASSSAPVPARNGPMSASSATASNAAAKSAATTAGLQAPTSRPWAVKMQSANSSAPAAPSVLPSKGAPTATAGGSAKRPAPKRSERAVNDRSAQRHRLWERARSSQHTIGVVDDDALESILSQVVDHAKPILFSDVNGLDECKDILYEAVVLPTKRPELFTGLRKPCSGLLLFGPPGNGKTMLASAVACECGTTFFNISAASLTSRWMGEGEKMVRALFSVARALAPSTIFIDEIDSLLQARGSSSEHEASRRLKTEFLVQMEGAGNDVSGSHVLTMAATNRPGDLDDAVIRRFPRRVLVPLPDAALRLMMVKKLLLGDAHADLSGATRTSKRARGSNSEDDEVKPRASANSVRVSLSPKEWQYLADHTENFSGSDLKGLCTDLAFAPLRALPAPARLEVRPEDLRPVSFDDVRGVLGRTQPSTTLGQLQGLEEWNSKYGSSAA